MMLRLVLVSMVAALGLTIPSRVECKRLFGSAETRASSFLAGWDTWRPGDRTGHKRSGPIATRECELCRLARVEAALRTQSPAVKVAIASTDVAGITADEWVEEVCGSLIREVQTAEAPSIAPDEWVEEVCGSLIREVQTAAMAVNSTQSAGESKVTIVIGLESDPLTATVRPTDGPDTSSLDPSISVEWSAAYGPDLFATVECQSARIDENNRPLPADAAPALVVSQSTPPSGITPLAPASTCARSHVPHTDDVLSSIPWPVFAPQVPDALAASPIAGEVQVPWPVFASSQPDPSHAAVFAPTVAISSEQQRVALASSDNPGSPVPSRLTMNIDPASPAITTAGLHVPQDACSPATSWVQAVHLTREALVAWMKVLAGPALVEVRAVSTDLQTPKDAPAAVHASASTDDDSARHGPSLIEPSHDGSSSKTARR